MNVKNTMALIASGGRLGKFLGGDIVFSAVAIPLCFVFSTLLSGKPLIVAALAGLFIVASIVVTHLATQGEGALDPQQVVLDSAVGVLVSFLFLPFWIKLTIFGFILFHLLSFLKRFVQLRGFAARFSNLPGALGLFVDDIFIGILVNVFMRLMMWIFV